MDEPDREKPPVLNYRSSPRARFKGVPIYRKILACILIAMGIFGTVQGLVNPSNDDVSNSYRGLAIGFVLAGLFIWFQRVKGEIE